MAAPDPKIPLQSYLRLQVKADREVLAILRGIKADVDKQLKSITGAGPGAVIRREQVRAAQREIKAAIDRGWVSLADVVRADALQAATAAVRANGEFDRPLLRQGLSDAQIDVLAKGQEAAAQQNVRAALNRVLDDTGATKIALSDKVYHSRVLLNGQVDRLVNSALARGLTAREFAKEVSGFINPNTPGGTRYAAMRLSRTELNNSFHFAQRRDNAAKPWVTGQKWYLSGSHPRPDECNLFAEENRFGLGPGVFAKNQVPNKPHPQCLCYVAPETVSEEQWLKDFKAGNYDEYIDERLPVSATPKPLPKPRAKPLPKSRARIPSTPEKVKYRNADLRSIRDRNDIRTKIDYDFADAASKARLRDAVIKRANEDLHIRTTGKALQQIVLDGRYKTIHEVARIRDIRSADYLKVRTDYEDIFMDLKGVAAKDRPIYGYTGPADQGSVSGYGDYTITLKRSVKDRTTVSAGDSLNGALDVHPPGEIADLSEQRLRAMVGSDNSRGLLKEGEWTQFMEAQIHGGVTLADIESVTVPSDAPPVVIRFLRRNNIKVIVELSDEEKLLNDLRRNLEK
jgi:hypothetical protein